MTPAAGWLPFLCLFCLRKLLYLSSKENLNSLFNWLKISVFLSKFDWKSKHSGIMAKKKRNQAAEQCENGKPSVVPAGHYTPKMTDLLGYDIIKNVYDSTILAIEDELRFSNEIRTKALQCAGLLTTLIVGLTAAICAVHDFSFQCMMTALAAVLVKCLYGLFWGIIYRKDNVHRGNTQSAMLCQQTIDRLQRVDGAQRAAFFLACNLKGMEDDVFRQKNRTEEMQRCFERETKMMLTLVTFILIVSGVLAFIFKLSLLVY